MLTEGSVGETIASIPNQSGSTQAAYYLLESAIARTAIGPFHAKTLAQEYALTLGIERAIVRKEQAIANLKLEIVAPGSEESTTNNIATVAEAAPSQGDRPLSLPIEKAKILVRKALSALRSESTTAIPYSGILEEIPPEAAPQLDEILKQLHEAGEILAIPSPKKLPGYAAVKVLEPNPELQQAQEYIDSNGLGLSASAEVVAKIRQDVIEEDWEALLSETREAVESYLGANYQYPHLIPVRCIHDKLSPQWVTGQVDRALKHLDEIGEIELIWRNDKPQSIKKITKQKDPSVEASEESSELVGYLQNANTLELTISEVRSVIIELKGNFLNGTPVCRIAEKISPEAAAKLEEALQHLHEEVGEIIVVVEEDGSYAEVKYIEPGSELAPLQVESNSVEDWETLLEGTTEVIRAFNGLCAHYPHLIPIKAIREKLSYWEVSQQDLALAHLQETGEVELISKDDTFQSIKQGTGTSVSLRAAKPVQSVETSISQQLAEAECTDAPVAATAAAQEPVAVVSESAEPEQDEAQPSPGVPQDRLPSASVLGDSAARFSYESFNSEELASSARGIKSSAIAFFRRTFAEIVRLGDRLSKFKEECQEKLGRLKGKQAFNNWLSNDFGGSSGLARAAIEISNWYGKLCSRMQRIVRNCIRGWSVSAMQALTKLPTEEEIGKAIALLKDKSKQTVTTVKQVVAKVSPPSEGAGGLGSGSSGSAQQQSSALGNASANEQSVSAEASTETSGDEGSTVGASEGENDSSANANEQLPAPTVEPGHLARISGQAWREETSTSAADRGDRPPDPSPDGRDEILDQLEQRLELLQQQYAQVAEENRHLKASGLATDSNPQVEQLQKQLEQERADKQAIAAQLQQLQQVLNEKEELQKELERERADKQAIAIRLQQVLDEQEESQKLKQLLEQIEKLENYKESASARLEKFVDENDRLIASIENLKSPASLGAFPQQVVRIAKHDARSMIGQMGIFERVEISDNSLGEIEEAIVITDVGLSNNSTRVSDWKNSLVPLNITPRELIVINQKQANIKEQKSQLEQAIWSLNQLAKEREIETLTVEGYCDIQGNFHKGLIPGLVKFVKDLVTSAETELAF